MLSVDMDDDVLTGTDIKFCVLSQYNLAYDGKGQARAHIMKDSATTKEFRGHLLGKTSDGVGAIQCADVLNYTRNQVN